MSVVFYTRYSPRPMREGEEERIAANEDAESIRLQLSVCHNYAIMKSLVVNETIKDPETSARHTPLFDREGGSKLRFLAPGSHVICSKLDRMFRSTADGLVTTAYFKNRNITLHFADQGGCTLDLSSADGEFMFTILLASAALEPRRTADRTSKAMIERQANGQRMTSSRTIPFGQMLDPENSSLTIPCKEELRQAEKAKNLRDSDFSLRQIANLIGPVRGKILSPQSVKCLIEKASST